MLIKRIIAGVLVSAAWVCALCILPGWVLFFVLLAMFARCHHEFHLMLKQGGFVSSRWWGLLIGTVWLAVCYACPPNAGKGFLPVGIHEECFVVTVLVFGVLVRSLFDARQQKQIEYTALTLLSFFYLPFMLGFFIRLAQWGATEMFTMSPPSVGIFLVGYVALVVKIGDVGAFTFGMTFGKHKMFPRISPKKSWEGFFGGLVTSVGASVLMLAIARHFSIGGPLAQLSWVHGIVLAVLLGVIGVLGDLVESMFKRAVQIKDSAALLPGMGGILDMFDSLIFAPAVFYFYLIWFAGKTVAL